MANTAVDFLAQLSLRACLQCLITAGSGLLRSERNHKVDFIYVRTLRRTTALPFRTKCHGPPKTNTKRLMMKKKSERLSWSETSKCRPGKSRQTFGGRTSRLTERTHTHRIDKLMTQTFKDEWAQEYPALHRDEVCSLSLSNTKSKQMCC